MANILFIGATQLKEKSIIQDNTDEKTLNISIKEFQEIEVEEILGKTEYDRLSSQLVLVQTGAIEKLSDSDTELMNHIVPLMVYGALMYSIPVLHQKINNTGVNVDKNINSETSDTQSARATYAFKMDAYKGKLIKHLKSIENSSISCQSSEDTTFNFTGMSLPDDNPDYDAIYKGQYYKTNGRRLI